MPLHILLIEDNSDDERLTIRSLQRMSVPMEIDVVRDGCEALNRLQNEELSLPDLVLLDLKLPKVSGLTVLRSVRTTPRTQNLPVVVMISQEVPTETQTEFDHFSCQSIEKPVSAQQFADVVTRFGLY